MNQSRKSPESLGIATARKIIAQIAKEHHISQLEAKRLVVMFVRREESRVCAEGWWRRLLDAQFLTHIGPYKRVRCGEETELAHLVPSPGLLCHDCGCAIGEYHVFGCDSEECSHCHEQAFCCECSDGSEEMQGDADDAA